MGSESSLFVCCVCRSASHCCNGYNTEAHARDTVLCVGASTAPLTLRHRHAGIRPRAALLTGLSLSAASTVAISTASIQRQAAGRGSYGSCFSSGHHGRHRHKGALLDALENKSLAIVGDYGTAGCRPLVAPLRVPTLSSTLTSTATSGSRSFERSSTSRTRSIRPYRRMPEFSIHGGDHRAWLLSAANRSRGHRQPRQVAQRRMSISMGAVLANVKAKSPFVHQQRRTIAVLFAPAYWHLTGACGLSRSAMLNATPEAIEALWLPWKLPQPPLTRYSPITPPIENLAPAFGCRASGTNEALSARFAAGDYFPPNWEP